MEKLRASGGAGEKGRRLFIALPLPEEVRRRLAGLRDELPERGFRGLNTDNFHITLVFLGDTPVSRIPDIEAAMRSAAEASGPFAARLGGLGAFPHPGEPRVVWKGLSRGGPEAGRLSDDLRRRLRREGVPFDGKPFAAHITLAYAGRSFGRAGLEEAGEAFIEFLEKRGGAAESERAFMPPDGPGARTAAEAESFGIGEIVLLESRPQPGGSVFTPVCRVPLGAP